MVEIFLVFISVLIGLCVWGLIANELTAKQRLGLMPEPKNPRFFIHLAYFNQVSYDQHMLYVFLLRNPYQLYNEELVNEN